MTPETLVQVILVAVAPAAMYAVCELVAQIRGLIRECRREV